MATQWDMIIHATSNIDNIIKDGYISNIVSKDDKQISDAKDGVYTHYYFDSIKREKLHGLNKWFGTYTLCISSNVLKDLNFIVYPTVSYGKHETVIFHKPGKLLRRPNMVKVKDHINNYIDATALDNPFSFIWSHEIVFLEPIPLKYIQCIVVSNSNFSKNKAEEYVTDLQILLKSHNLNIPVFETKKYEFAKQTNSAILKEEKKLLFNIFKKYGTR